MKLHNAPRIGQFLFLLFAIFFAYHADWEMVGIMVVAMLAAEFSCFCIRYSQRKQWEAEVKLNNERANAENHAEEMYKIEAQLKKCRENKP